MYPGLASAIEGKLSYEEWRLVACYVNKADSLGEEAESCSSDSERKSLESRARDALSDAVDVALAAGEESAASKIAYYKRFY